MFRKPSLKYPHHLKIAPDRQRHLLKTISWRAIGTLDTLLITWLITGSLEIGAAVGGTEVITKMLLYYAHERVWYRYIRIGRGKVADAPH